MSSLHFYLRDKKNHKRVMILATKVDEKVKVTYACQNPKDKFNKEFAMKLCKRRLTLFDERSEKKTLNSIVLKKFDYIYDKCSRYFKVDQNKISIY